MSPPPTLSLDNIEMSSYRHTERKESEREKESCQYGCFIYRAFQCKGKDEPEFVNV